MSESKHREIVVAGTVDDEQPAQDALNVDCWEKVFDYLSIEDVCRMGNTCKRLQRIAKYYIQIQEYSLNGSPLLNGYSWHSGDNTFNEFITEMDIESRLRHHIHAESFGLLKKLTLYEIHLTETEFGYFEGILGNIESLTIERCEIDGELMVQILQNCPKLKRLSVKYNPSARSASSWFWQHHKYPSIEHLELDTFGNDTGLKLATFLENNSNVKCLIVDYRTILNNQDSFRKANIQLDSLEIGFRYDSSAIIVESINLLNELHERQFFKTLRLTEPQQIMDLMAPLSHTLEALETGIVVGDISAFTKFERTKMRSFR